MGGPIDQVLVDELCVDDQRFGDNCGAVAGTRYIDAPNVGFTERGEPPRTYAQLCNI